jgi:hypothetical protein
VAQPTVRQIYALAAALCERIGEEFPETREQASETIERLRIENGHPAPRREDTPRRVRRPERRRDERLARRAASELAEELEPPI